MKSIGSLEDLLEEVSPHPKKAWNVKKNINFRLLDALNSFPCESLLKRRKYHGFVGTTTEESTLDSRLRLSFSARYVAVCFILLILQGNGIFVFYVLGQKPPVWLINLFQLSVLAVLVGGLFLLLEARKIGREKNFDGPY